MKGSVARAACLAVLLTLCSGVWAQAADDFFVVASGGNDWKLNGNAGTTPGTHFLGTKDNQALELKVNGQRAMRLEPDPSAPKVIGGYEGNSIDSSYTEGATIAGGGSGGGYPAQPNQILAGGQYSAIGGGIGNSIKESYAGVIAGGGSNIIGANAPPFNPEYSVIGGGLSNAIEGWGAVIAGGYENTAQGYCAMIAGGWYNSADGDHTLAAGRRAKAVHDGAFVWADSSNFDFASDGSNRFGVRSTGGARFVSAIDGSGNPTAGVVLHAGAGSWSMLSDRNLKENFAPVDGREVLDRLSTMPIGTWNFKAQETSVRHLGPVAQDFHQAFRLGEDQRSISTVDANGVALAAIQGLYQVLQEREAEIRDLRSRLDALEGMIARNRE